MQLFKFVLCLAAGAASCYLFGGFVQTHNPFENDFRVQAYGLAFIAGFLLFRLILPAILILTGCIAPAIKSNR